MAKRTRSDHERRGKLLVNFSSALEVGESETGSELLRRLSIMASQHPIEFVEDIAEALILTLDGIEKVRGWRAATDEGREPARVIALGPRREIGRPATPDGAA